MNNIVFKDCEYRFLNEDMELCCKNKPNNLDMLCDNCMENIHLNCENYVPRNDMCLKWFELGVSEVSQYDNCAEKVIYDDKQLSRKWSN